MVSLATADDVVDGSPYGHVNNVLRTFSGDTALRPTTEARVGARPQSKLVSSLI